MPKRERWESTVTHRYNTQKCEVDQENTEERKVRELAASRQAVSQAVAT